ncbi:kinase-like domain-containing protein [Phycomyces nitens]|nr:kinase-like domain-containing protein [Phycomyces nitens]
MSLPKSISLWADSPESSPESSKSCFSNNPTTSTFPTDPSYINWPSNEDLEPKDPKLPLQQTMRGSQSRRNQTKMLLVSLIEYFCNTYGDSPDANHRVFFLICQTLRSLGFIDAEFVDEVASVRSTFQIAFRKLFYTAIQTVNNQHLPRIENDQRLILPNVCQGSNASLDSLNFGSLSLMSPHLENEASDGKVEDLFSKENGFYNLSVHNSRYRNDFVELGLLGKGGFASAWKARNKLDGIEYALKKIRLGQDLEEEYGKDNPYEKIFREIKNLARLEHQNVIRYYASWLEYDDSNRKDDSDNDSHDNQTESLYESQTEDNSETTGDDTSSVATFSMAEQQHIWEEPSDMGIVFEAGSAEPSREVFEDSFNQTKSFVNNPSRSSGTYSLSSGTQASRSKTRKYQGSWTLFIQMQLCPTTLFDYIKTRNQEGSTDSVDCHKNILLFSQILQGAAYIHDRGLIHRDLKPSNIFLSVPFTPSENNGRDSRRSSLAVPSEEPPRRKSICSEEWVPKIGDFGLAATVLDESGDATIVLPTSIESGSKSRLDNGIPDTTTSQNLPKRRPKLPMRTRTIGVGTRTYASPEQLAVPVQAYDEKVDIYSLGIIFFELYQPFTTGMERATAIDRLKDGLFPDGFVKRFPKESALILWMMDKDPAKRPSAQRLLEFELFAQANDTLDLLQTRFMKKSDALEIKTHEVEVLKKRLEHMEQEQEQSRATIDEMGQKLAKMQDQLNKAISQGFKVE